MNEIKTLRRWTSLDGEFHQFLTIGRYLLPAEKPNQIPCSIESDCIVTARVFPDHEEITEIKPRRKRL